MRLALDDYTIASPTLRMRREVQIAPYYVGRHRYVRTRTAHVRRQKTLYRSPGNRDVLAAENPQTDVRREAKSGWY